MRRFALIAAVLLYGVAAGQAGAAPALVELGRFTDPVAAVSPPGDLRVFVVEKTGTIRIVDGTGTILSTPFLDVTGQLAQSQEQGLLNLAFSPDYGTTGRFYVYLTATGGEVQVREYQRSATDANRADPSTMRFVLRQGHSEAGNHNGGSMAFGPDGRLWFGIGDGGGGDNDAVPNSAQSDATFLGKIVRVVPGQAAEIFHKGLRNPWRFSFDRVTGDLIIGDVGQEDREEIDVARAADGWLPGANWGWPCWEGTLRNDGAPSFLPCDPPDDLPPAFELRHVPPPHGDGAVSITGGVVVRDAGLPTLNGRYLYGDYGMDVLRSLVISEAGTASGDRREPTLAVSGVSSIDQDACGRVLVSTLPGTVYRVVDGAPSACDPSSGGGPGGGAPGAGGPGGGAGPGASGPASTCAMSIRAPRRRTLRALRRGGIPVAIRVRAACRVRLGGRRLRARTVRLVAGERRVIRLRLARGAAAGRRTMTITVRGQAATGAPAVRHARVRIV